MDFSWSDDDLALQDAVLQLGKRELQKGTLERDKRSEFHAAGWAHCGALGLCGLTVPEEHGGLGASAVTLAGVLEALGYACTDNGLSFSIAAHLLACVMPVVEAGSAAQKAKYLPDLASGKLIAANAMSEPSAGSDAFALRMRAEKRPDGGYRLNGNKTFTTNAPIAGLFLVFANVSPTHAKSGVTAFLVERDTPGLRVGAPVEKMGLRTSPMSDVYFEDCDVPEEARLGREGAGALLFSTAMVWERAFILSSAVGAMRRLVERCTAYARERKQYGHTIGQYQSVSNRIVDMQLRMEASRGLLYRTAWVKDQGERCYMEAAMTKLFLSESWLQTAQDAVQIFGGYGYMEEYELAREVRDATGSRIYSGTSEIQRNIVAGMLGLG